MSDAQSSTPSHVTWVDLTVPNAEELRDFYQQVAGWKVENLDVGGYDDYVMTDPATGEGIAGICHKRGVNENLPPVWLVYIPVPDLNASIAAVRRMGGNILREPDAEGEHRYAVIKDPAGAVCALIQAGG